MPLHETRYLSVAETAKLVRAALKKEFPAVKFSVRSSSYAGGASIRVVWTDGPLAKVVDAIAQEFCGGNFDGSIDLKTSHSSWLLPDGSAMIAVDSGTVGSLGSHPAIENGQPHDDAELVHFGADFIFTERKTTLATALVARDLVVTYWGGVDYVPELVETVHGWYFAADSDSYRLVRDDLGSRDYEWRTQIHRAIETPERFARESR